MKERVNMMIPIPPSHWVSALQKSIPADWDSMLAITVAPVVVNPDTDSKKASVIRGISPLIR